VKQASSMNKTRCGNMDYVLHWCRYHLEHCTETGKSTSPITCTLCWWYGWSSCSCNMHQMTMWFAHMISAVCHVQTEGILVTRWRTSSLYSGMHVVPNQPALCLVTSRVPVLHHYWMVHAKVVWCVAYLWGNLSAYILWACLPHKPAHIRQCLLAETAMCGMKTIHMLLFYYQHMLKCNFLITAEMSGSAWNC
jgi:hypothetical protein